MNCNFINELGKLKKSSIESVDNINEFNEFNQYMHVCRHIEDELRTLLKEVNKVNKKTLILLCGSAGDGKSHLLSYFKNGDVKQEFLLEGYNIYNDATESDSPTKTSIETLNERLSDFNDQNLNYGNSKTILAINLGILNKFIESEYGENFTQLKKYVNENGILLEKNINKYNENSIFQHITFSDYQMFSINKDGYKTDFLNKLFDKVFNEDEKNPFNYEFKNAEKKCDSCKYCPVRHNYIFLKGKQQQQAIINRIVEVILKDKVLLSTRDILNFIYNIIVSPEFKKDELLNMSSTDEYDFFTYYISCTTPMLIDEFKDISNLQNYMMKYDVLKLRTEELDEDAIAFYSKENIVFDLKQQIKNTSYNEISNFFTLENLNDNLKTNTFKFIKRLEKLLDISSDKNIVSFIKNIYNNSISNDMELQKVFIALINSIRNWNGLATENFICFDNSNEHYWLLEEVEIEPIVHDKITNPREDIYRFNTSLKLGIKNKGKKFEIDIDYHLYELINNINNGYCINGSDKNFYTDFNRFVTEIMSYGNKNIETLIISKENKNKIITIKENSCFKNIEVSTKGF